MRISREAILIAVAAEQILTRDSGVDIDLRRSRFLRYEQRWRREEITVPGGPFDGWKISELPWAEFMRCIYSRRQRFAHWDRIATEREFKRRVSEKRDVLVRRVYGMMRGKREFDRVKQALIRWCGRDEWREAYEDLIRRPASRESSIIERAE